MCRRHENPTHLRTRQLLLQDLCHTLCARKVAQGRACLKVLGNGLLTALLALGLHVPADQTMHLHSMCLWTKLQEAQVPEPLFGACACQPAGVSASGHICTGAHPMVPLAHAQKEEGLRASRHRLDASWDSTEACWQTLSRCARARKHTHAHTHANTHAKTRAHTRKHGNTHTRAHAHKHARKNTRTHTQARSHTRTRTHTHMLIQSVKGLGGCALCWVEALCALTLIHEDVQKD